MQLGIVVGNVWATRKHEGLSSYKMMIVKPYEYGMKSYQDPIIAMDTIGSGVGETVLVVGGSSARMAVGDGNAPIDKVIVGIVDTVDVHD